MEVTFRNFQRTFPVDGERVRRIAEETLSTVGRPDGIVAVVFVGVRKMREMNRLYRSVDSVTDVLSFPRDPETPGPEAGGEMGDVVIAAARAAEQAVAGGRSLAEEIDLLVVHGILHLAGYDHGEELERKRMERFQEKILGGGAP